MSMARAIRASSICTSRSSGATASRATSVAPPSPAQWLGTGHPLLPEVPAEGPGAPEPPCSLTGRPCFARCASLPTVRWRWRA
jgi:hypothetical protein